MDKLTSYDICTKYGCLSRIFTLITYFVMLFVVIFIRLVPVLLAVKILILLLAEYFVVSSLLIGLVSSITDLLIAIGLLILSLTFKFCIYHRLIIYYVFVSYISYIISILFEFSLTNIVFISSFLCLTIIVIFLVVYTYLRYGDKKQW